MTMQHESALEPEDLARFFVLRANAGDVDAVAYDRLGLSRSKIDADMRLTYLPSTCCPRT